MSEAPAKQDEAKPAPRRPTLVPPPEPEPSLWRLVLPLVLAALLPRLLVFFFTQNLYGDAVVRTDLAARWANDPHFIRSFDDGAFQFGPLHLYLVGLALKLGLPQTDAGRWVSVLFGTLSVLPLFAISRRLYDWRAGVWACLLFSVWGVHLQASTTAASEALGLFLVLCLGWQLLKALQLGTFKPLFYAALLTNLACAVRYDAWPFIPLLAVLLTFNGRDRVAGVTRGVLYLLMSLPFPLLWMHGNEVATGSAIFPIRYIDDFHRNWATSEIAWMGQARFRVQSLFFWPGAALVTFTPIAGALGLYGFIRACIKRPSLRWLGYWVLAPTLYYAVKSALLLSFVPLARFTLNQIVFVLPFVLYGFEALFGEAKPVVRRAVAGTGVALAVAFPLWLAFFTYYREGRMQDALRPISPVTTNPRPVMNVAQLLKRELKGQSDGVVLDTDSEYRDLQVAFFSELPETQLARYRWQPDPKKPDDHNSFPERLKTLTPRYIVLSAKGALRNDARLSSETNAVTFDGRKFSRVPGFDGPFFVYRAN
ncbi:MAG: ArnT family glycosyltransferase [Myxococcaceae bacterium]